jgi:hypothetical protein
MRCLIRIELMRSGCGLLFMSSSCASPRRCAFGMSQKGSRAVDRWASGDRQIAAVLRRQIERANGLHSGSGICGSVPAIGGLQ